MKEKLNEILKKIGLPPLGSKKKVKILRSEKENITIKYYLYLVPAILVMLAGIIAAVYFGTGYVNKLKSETGYTPIPAEKLNRTGYYEEKYYMAAKDHFSDVYAIDIGLNRFVEKTGVQPFFYFSDDIMLTAGDDKADRAIKAIYDSHFTDQAHLLIVVTGNGSVAGEYELAFYPGEDVKSHMDSKAYDIIEEIWEEKASGPETDQTGAVISSTFLEAPGVIENCVDNSKQIMIATIVWVAVAVLFAIAGLVYFLIWRKKKRYALDGASDVRPEPIIIDPNAEKFSKDGKRLVNVSATDFESEAIMPKQGTARFQSSDEASVQVVNVSKEAERRAAEERAERARQIAEQQAAAKKSAQREKLVAAEREKSEEARKQAARERAEEARKAALAKANQAISGGPDMSDEARKKDAQDRAEAARKAALERANAAVLGGNVYKNSAAMGIDAYQSPEQDSQGERFSPMKSRNDSASAGEKDFNRNVSGNVNAQESTGAAAFAGAAMQTQQMQAGQPVQSAQPAQERPAVAVHDIGDDEPVVTTGVAANSAAPLMENDGANEEEYNGGYRKFDDDDSALMMSGISNSGGGASPYTNNTSTFAGNSSVTGENGPTSYFANGGSNSNSGMNAASYNQAPQNNGMSQAEIWSARNNNKMAAQSASQLAAMEAENGKSSYFGNSGNSGTIDRSTANYVAPSPYAQQNSAPSPYAKPDNAPQFASQSSYGQQNVAPSPYAQQNVAPSPYAQQNAAPSPYAQQNVAPSPYAQQNAAPSPYAQQNSAPQSSYTQPAQPSQPAQPVQPAQPSAPSYSQPAEEGVFIPKKKRYGAGGVNNAPSGSAGDEGATSYFGNNASTPNNGVGMYNGAQNNNQGGPAGYWASKGVMPNTGGNYGNNAGNNNGRDDRISNGDGSYKRKKSKNAWTKDGKPVQRKNVNLDGEEEQQSQTSKPNNGSQEYGPDGKLKKWNNPWDDMI